MKLGLCLSNPCLAVNAPKYLPCSVSKNCIKVHSNTACTSSWGSRGRRFKSCPPDQETAGQTAKRSDLFSFVRRLVGELVGANQTLEKIAAAAHVFQADATATTIAMLITLASTARHE